MVIEALRERKTLSELCKEFELHLNQISDWKKQVLGVLPSIFEKENATKKIQETDIEEITAPLYQKIGHLKLKVDYLKKNLVAQNDRLARFKMVDASTKMSIQRQCELLGLARSSYYNGMQSRRESLENLASCLRWINCI
jgi:putative transposase